MHLRSKITLAFTLFISVLFANEYTDNVEIVRQYYPNVYKSIEDQSQQKWGNLPEKRTQMFNEQINAFLSIAESNSIINESALTDAILKYSLPNERDNNEKIVDDLSIDNPFPYLMCDWINVKNEYLKSGNKLEQLQIKQVRDYKPMNVGIRLGLGMGKMNGVDKVEGVTSDLGVAVDFGVVFIYQKNDFFLQSEVLASLLMSEVKKGSESHRLNPVSLYLQVHAGLDKEINKDLNFVIGVGGFGGYINTTTRSSDYYDYDYDYYRDITTRNSDDSFYPQEEDFKKFNYGVSALVGLEYKSMQFSVIPSLGLADLSKDGLGFKTRGLVFSATFLFF